MNSLMLGLHRLNQQRNLRVLGGAGAAVSCALLLIAAIAHAQHEEKVVPASKTGFRLKSERRFRTWLFAALLMFPAVQQSWSAVNPAWAPNWSGYVVPGPQGSVTDVKGSWIAPAVNCTGLLTTSASSFWVGIDGDKPAGSGATVEQIGTQSNCKLGSPHYYAWYQFVPENSGQQIIPSCPSGQSTQCITVQPGDVISAEVSFGGGQFTVTMTDTRSGAVVGNYSTSAENPGAKQASAEWIAEDPQYCTTLGCFLFPLANFGTIPFGFENTGIPGTCQATVTTVSSQSLSIGALANFLTVQEITMTSNGTQTGEVKAAPSALSPDGSSFSVSYGPHNTWSSGASMPVPAAPGGAGVLDGKIYVVGGGNSTGLIANTQIYDPLTNTWSTGTPLPVATSGTVAVAGGLLYVISGDSATGLNTNAVWAYSPKTKAWSSKAPIPTPRANARAAVEGGKIYVSGGYNVNYGGFLTTVESYDPATNQWTEDQPMLNPESDGVSGTVGTTIIVTDASDGFPDGNNQEYNPSTNSWSFGAADPTLRQATCGGSAGSVFYSAGGWNGVNGSAALTLTESFTPSTNQWKTLAPIPQGTFGGVGTGYKGRLYCFGGVYSDGGADVGTVQIYQP